MGYVWDITDEHELDVCGKYIWPRVQGTDETLTAGDRFELDDMDSSRVRFDAGYTYKGSERFNSYVGAAWEPEFAGSCESTAFDCNVAAPSFEGGHRHGRTWADHDAFQGPDPFRQSGRPGLCIAFPAAALSSTSPRH